NLSETEKKVTKEVLLLTGEWADLPGKHLLRYFGVSTDGDRVIAEFDETPPVCFVSRSARLPASVRPAERRPLEMTTFEGIPVDALYFPGYNDLRRAARELEGQGVVTYEADVRPERRFLMERFVFAQACFHGAASRQGAFLVFRNPRITPVELTAPPLRIASFDIETGYESGELYSIAIQVGDEQGTREAVWVRDPDPDPTGKSYLPVGDEKDLLAAFCEFVRREDPDILTGWNVVGFDVDFLIRRAEALGASLPLSRTGRPPHLRAKRPRGGPRADLSGRVIIDAMTGLRYAYFQFEDMRLETVARELLGRGKAIQAEEAKIDEIERMFAADKNALATYNLEDCRLVTEILRKTGLIEQLVRRSQISGMLLPDVGGSVAAFDHFYLPHLHRKGMVAPNAYDIHGEEQAAGGLVWEPIAGIHREVIVLDFRSLYPSIIQTFKIEPYARLMAGVDPLETPRGYRFSRSLNFLPGFIAGLLERRAEAKAAGDSHLSQAIKILMNSLYGVMGSFGCRFYHPDLPNAITSTGHWLLNGCKDYLEQRGYAVLYGDTDSLFVQLREGEGERAAAVGRELAVDLNRHWRKVLGEKGLESFLEMEYEKSYAVLVLPRSRGGGGGARKRYAGLLRRKGGDGPTGLALEFVGMEYVRSDWTPLARQFQFELYNRFLRGESVQGWLRQYIRDIHAGRYDEAMVYYKKLRKDPQEYTHHLSPQVRAAQMLGKPVREIRYLMTREGPVPINKNPGPPDYAHYIDRQIRPIADSLLGLAGKSLDSLIGPQQLSFLEGPDAGGEDDLGEEGGRTA
ncbi:MAG: DNA polymerase II, partial [Calditrichaeota bacterium]|nr:DNA polymerase II [Calditrichota bacterium]